ncbi:MAG: exosortase U [Planctomycetaceae bacterium]|nr:exosortase U [Planctomycetaceae bacterium]
MSTDVQKRPQWIVAAVVAAHAAFLISMAIWLWSREHYQFFPLVLMGSGLLAWLRLADTKWNHAPVLTVRVVGLGMLSVAVFAVAVWFNSNWIGSIGAIISLWTAIRYVGGPAIARRLRGPVAFLFLAIPLPLNLDLTLVIELQKLATRLASNMLDDRRIWHTVSGVAITTLDRNFMVEEACSGVHSLFSCVTAVAFFCVFQRYGLFRSLLVLLFSMGWVVLANVFRVFLVVYANAAWQQNLDTGWRHDLLGIGTYVGALICSLSTAQLLEFFVPVVWGKLSDSPTGKGKPGDQYYGGENDPTVRQKIRQFLDRPRLDEAGSGRIVNGTLALCMLPLCVLSLYQLLPSASAGTGGAAFQTSVLESVTESSTPAKYGQWKRTAVDKVERSADDPLGTNSVVYTYEGNGMLAQFSVDGYYGEWHDLAYCYTALDWKLNEARNVTLDGNHGTVLDLYKESGENAVSWFSCFDGQHTSVEPPDPSGSTLRTLLNRFRQEQSSQSITPPVYQCQLMVASEGELLPHELDQAKELFVELTRAAVSDMRKGVK